MAEEKKEVYSSIFDAASKLERKKAVEKALREAESETGGALKATPLTNEEIAEKLDNYKKLHNLLADQIEQAFVKSNLTPRRLRDYFSTPQNFTTDQWRLIEQERETIDGMLARLIPHPRERL